MCSVTVAVNREEKRRQSNADAGIATFLSERDSHLSPTVREKQRATAKAPVGRARARHAGAGAAVDEGSGSGASRDSPDRASAARAGSHIPAEPRAGASGADSEPGPADTPAGHLTRQDGEAQEVQDEAHAKPHMVSAAMALHMAREGCHIDLDDSPREQPQRQASDTAVVEEDMDEASFHGARSAPALGVGALRAAQRSRRSPQKFTTHRKRQRRRVAKPLITTEAASVCDYRSDATVDDTCAWLEMLGLRQLCPIFQNNQVNGEYARPPPCTSLAWHARPHNPSPLLVHA